MCFEIMEMLKIITVFTMRGLENLSNVISLIRNNSIDGLEALDLKISKTLKMLGCYLHQKSSPVPIRSSVGIFTLKMQFPMFSLAESRKPRQRILIYDTYSDFCKELLSLQISPILREPE